MMTPNHQVLVVEDDASMREELTGILRSHGFDVGSCGDKLTALRLVDEQAFCMMLMDLQIFDAPDSIRPMEIHGQALIREIRRKYPERNGLTDWRFPVLVVSGFAKEGSQTKEVIRAGASDIVWKQASLDLTAELSRAIQQQLQASGREDHADCCLTPLELSIPGERQKQRSRVMLGVRSAYLTDRCLRVLLHLIKGKLNRAWVHNLEMGFGGDGGNRIPSEVDNEMRKTFPPNITRIIENDHHGGYSLIDEVTIGEIAYDRLVAIEDNKMATLAREIQQLRASSGNS